MGLSEIPSMWTLGSLYKAGVLEFVALNSVAVALPTLCSSLSFATNFAYFDFVAAIWSRFSFLYVIAFSKCSLILDS